MTDTQTRHTRGVLVVLLMGMIFLALLALIIVRSGGRKNAIAPSRSETLTVLPMRIRVRTEPNARAPVVATATTGEQLQLVEDQGQWVRVQTSDGLVGWAERINLERTIERERRVARSQAIRKLPALNGVTTSHAQLYAGPGIFYPLVGELPAGASVRVFTRDHDFYAIDYAGQVAYGDVDNIDVTASGAPQLNVATSTASPTATETTSTETTTSTEAPATASEAPPAPAAPEIAESLRNAEGVYTAVPPGGTQPEEVNRVVPRYPMAARQANVGGSVVIRGIVRRDGTIDDVQIIKDLPYGLGDAAREAVERWRFRPATFQGDPIDVYYTVTVNFRLR